MAGKARNFPRTTEKVMRGLALIASYYADADWRGGWDDAGYTRQDVEDAQTAFNWMLEVGEWLHMPRRKQPIPPQLRKVIKSRFLKRD